MEKPSILCDGDTHVFQLNSTTCDCGAWGATAQPVNPYPLYYPQGYRPQHYTPPSGQAPDVNISTFKAAQRAGASHLSADGMRVYTTRYGETLEAEWKERLRDFGAWSVCPEGLPADAVKM